MIIGHVRQIEYLKKVMERGTLAHAYLFTGPAHVGKRTMARALAKALYCEIGSVMGGECECRSCRDIASGNHSSVITIDTDHTLASNKEERKDIPIEDIRELKRRFSLSAVHGTWRVAIISEADKLSLPAANAFLKLLEEPGARTLFLLVAPSKDTVLQTIASRAIVMPFGLVSEQELRSFLAGQKLDESAESALEAASGRPGILISFLADPEFAHSNVELKKEFDVAWRSIPDAFLLAQRVASDKEERIRVMDHVISALRRELLSSQTIRSAAAVKAVDRIIAYARSTNVNPRLALDAMFLESFEGRGM